MATLHGQIHLFVLYFMFLFSGGHIGPPYNIYVCFVEKLLHLSAGNGRDRSLLVFGTYILSLHFAARYGGGRRTRTYKGSLPSDFKSDALPIRTSPPRICYSSHPTSIPTATII